MTLLWLIVVIGGICAFIAGAMAWAITYEEYAKHYFPDRAPAIRHATQTATTTVLFFVALSASLGWLLQRLLGPA